MNLDLVAFAVIGAEGRGNRNIHLDVSTLRRAAVVLGAATVSAALLLPLNSSNRLENVSNLARVEHVQGAKVEQSRTMPFSVNHDPEQGMRDGLRLAGESLKNGNPVGFVASVIYTIGNSTAAANGAAEPAKAVKTTEWHFTWDVPPTPRVTNVVDHARPHSAGTTHEHRLRASKRRD